MKKINIYVYGRVQGVGFRYMTKMVADRLKLGGIVQNEDDGSVYIEANGPDEEIDRFIQLVQASPSPSGRVDRIEVNEDETIPERKKFSVTGY